MTDRQNKTSETPDLEALRRYLFFESDEAERGRLETRFFDDDELFYDLLDLENILTDRYARNELDAADKRRFESSLEKSPERRAKLNNAIALQSFVKEESASILTLENEKDRATFWQRLTNFFNLTASKFQYSAVAILLLLLTTIGFLIYERQRNVQELARLREVDSQRISELQKQEQSLQEQIETIQQREQNLQNELAEKNGQADILTEQLTREQSEKARIERELENLKRQKQSPIQPFSPTVATIFLTPIGGKGSGDAQIFAINKNATMIFATLQIPEESVAENFTVSLNSAPLGEKLRPNQTKSGSKFVRINFPAKLLSFEKENLISIIGNDNSRFNYVLRRQK